MQGRPLHGFGDESQDDESASRENVEDRKLASSLEGLDEDALTPPVTAAANQSVEVGLGEQVQGSGGGFEIGQSLRHMSPAEQEPRPGDLDEPSPVKRFGWRMLAVAVALVAVGATWFVLPEHDEGMRRKLIHGPAGAPPASAASLLPKKSMPAAALQAPEYPNPSQQTSTPPRPASRTEVGPRKLSAPQHHKRPVRTDVDERETPRQNDPDSTLPPTIE